jgi:hypothetical protein
MSLLANTDLSPVLFIDIETVPMQAEFEQIPASMQVLWEEKHAFIGKDFKDAKHSFESKAGIYAEFGKIICISIGIFQNSSKKRMLRIKSFAGPDEKIMLGEFSALLHEKFNSSKHNICGHNIKEFDVPFLCRRMLMHGIALPELLDVAGKKPWETPFLDTMQLWRFGDYKNFTSLKLLAAVMGIDTPKDDIEGKDVARVFWQEQDLDRIVQYCQKDVLTVAQLMLRFTGKEILKKEEVTFV